MINSFIGSYRFLSNFWLCKIPFDDLVYPSVEHAYQAAKTFSEEHRQKILNSITPGDAKKLGRLCFLREDWKEIKLEVMKNLVTRKFFLNEELAKKLIETKDHDLVEGNTWGDTFWGVCGGVGQNHLGRIIMEVRANLLDYFE